MLSHGLMTWMMWGYPHFRKPPHVYVHIYMIYSKIVIRYWDIVILIVGILLKNIAQCSILFLIDDYKVLNYLLVSGIIIIHELGNPFLTNQYSTWIRICQQQQCCYIYSGCLVWNNLKHIYIVLSNIVLQYILMTSMLFSGN